MSGRGLDLAPIIALLFGAALVTVTFALVRLRRALRIRTHTMGAFCHDVLTPLARLRLRAERTDSVQREAMLREIDGIDRMLREALAFVMDDARAAAEHVDLVSVLTTICCDFAEVGHRVVYDGPERLTLRCRAAAIARAVTNVVDNATKHGRHVQIRLIDRRSTVDVEISDDGPGIPMSLRRQVFHPFFKGGDGGHASRDRSFGLGLAIAQEIARSHRGRIALEDRAPRGLTVRISLPGSLVVRQSSTRGSTIACLLTM